MKNRHGRNGVKPRVNFNLASLRALQKARRAEKRNK